MKRRSGVALIIVLWISAILTLLVYSFLRTMVVEYSLAASYGAEKQAEQLALSGIERGLAILASDETLPATLQEDWADNEEEFLEYRLGDGFFTLTRPTLDEQTPRLHGATDEASKININSATRDLLMNVPGMTDEIADSILDWRDEDEEPRGNGAESSYYLFQDPGYSCKNEPFETVEELLFVRGVTSGILYGDDKNLNGVRDAFEDQTGDFNPGLYAYLTAWSYEPTVGNDGESQVDLNQATDQQLRDRLGDVLSGQAIAGIQLRRLESPFRSTADLLAVGGVTKEAFKEVADRCTVVDAEQIPGRINVNTAPKDVLRAIPGMEEEWVSKIVEQRAVEDAELSNIGWLTDILENGQVRTIGPYITTRSFQFRLDSVGVIEPEEEITNRPRPFRRIVAVVDGALDSPRLIYWKDWSRFGLPYPVGREE